MFAKTGSFAVQAKKLLPFTRLREKPTPEPRAMTTKPSVGTEAGKYEKHVPDYRSGKPAELGKYGREIELI